MRKEYNRIFGIQNSQQSAKKGISIIIAANNAAQYIEECLDSIKNQSYFANNNNYQIIVCADGCEKTLQKLNSIKSKYKNLTITSSAKKLGTFVTLNNLLRSCSHNSIMHFHPEDIMTHELVEEVMQYVDNFDIIKFDYQDFQDNISNPVNNKFWFNGGICVYNKKVISLTGGFLSWIYAADIEMIERVYNHVKIKKIEKALYYKREMPGDMMLGTKKHPRKEFLQKIRRYSVNENVCILPAKVELPIEEVKDDDDDEFIPKVNHVITPLKPGISILVTAYKSQNFIEQCLDSIENQTYFKDNNEFEVLLGIDACEETLEKVQEIRHKYRNLSVYMMKENKGTYVTTNTLIGLAKYENLLRFDSDDVMMKYMVSEIMNVHEKYDYIRFKFRTFTKDITLNSKASNMFALGVVFYKKSVFDILGGYQDWRCSGDYELFTRAQGKIKMLSLGKELFFRRDHPNNLSNKSDTALGSSLRLQYQKQVRTYHAHENAKIDRVINHYDKVDENKSVSKLIDNKKIPISIIVTAWKTQDYIEECLDSIENQTYFKDNDNFEVLVGVDACQDTLKKLLEIRHKYRNLRIFMMKENKGTYVTSNTLLDLVKYENILRFDSDDIMKPEMISTIMNNANSYDIIRFYFYNFINTKDNIVNINRYASIGAIFFKKYVIDISGGYRAWRCAADNEILERIKNYTKTFEISTPLFYRRLHKESLINNPETNIDSNLRKSYRSQIREYRRGENIKIETVVSNYQEIYTPYIYDISFIIPIRGREDQIEGLEYNIKQFFGDYNYEIIYVNQNDNKLFKRGQLCNIGFKESNGNIIIFQDVDIRHLRKIDIKKLLSDFNSPFVAFDAITQINEKKLGEYEQLTTEKRMCGFGACAIFLREQFIKSGGFSNLIFGWGTEDNILNERAKFQRLNQDLGHVYHDPLRKDKKLHETKFYRNNQSVYLNNKNFTSQDDGFKQTAYNIISKITKDINIHTLHVNNIGVASDYKYISLYEQYVKEDIEIKEQKVPLNNKLKILLLADRPGWAFDNIANAIIKYNPYSNIEYTKQFIRSDPNTYIRSDFIKNQFKYDDWDYVYVFFEDARDVQHDPKKLIKGCYSALWLETTRITKESLGKSFNTCRGIIFANETLRDLLTPYCPNLENTIISDASDPIIFYPTNEPRFEEFTVLFVGNTEREIKRFKIIQEICEEAKIKLIVAKDISHNELYKLYNKVHLCINFSISEGGPQTLFESALCNTPMIINSDIPMSKKIPCFSVSTKKEMVEKLLYLKDNVKEVFKMGEEARKVVLENYTYSSVSKKFGDFFLKIANKDSKINDITAFVITFGNSPNFQDCIDALNKQTFPCRIEIIKNYAPSSVAFQEMLNRCKTKYYVQVDDDMILNPNAIEIMYNAITSSDEKTAMITYMLHDVHLNFDIVGIKIFKHALTKNYPYNTDPNCPEIPTMNQMKRLETAGYNWFSNEKMVIGEHSPKWTNELIFERYYDLMDKYKMYGYVWLKDLPQKLEKMYKKDPSDLNYYAMMGAKMSIDSKKIRNRQKDYRIIDENFLKIKAQREYDKL